MILSGTIAPQVTISTATLAFGTVAQGVTTGAQVVNVTNNGGQPVTLNIPTTPTLTTPVGVSATPFAASADATTPCGATLAAGQSCNQDFTFTAGTTNGAYSASFVVGGGPTLSLTATVVSPATLALYGFTNSPVALGAVTTTSNPTGTLAVWYQNTGGVAAALQAPTLTAGANTVAGEFTIVSEGANA